MKNSLLLSVALVSAVLTACSSPTGAGDVAGNAATNVMVPGAPALSGGFGMGSGNVTGGSGGETNEAAASDEATATTSSTLVPCDEDSRGGFGMGSGNYSDACPVQINP
jgi:predicted small secreted protein